MGQHLSCNVHAGPPSARPSPENASACVAVCASCVPRTGFAARVAALGPRRWWAASPIDCREGNGRIWDHFEQGPVVDEISTKIEGPPGGWKRASRVVREVT